MVTVSMLLFWIPVCIGIISFFYFTKHSRKVRILVLSFLPIAFFIVKIIRHTFYHPLSILFLYITGLFLSTILFIFVLRYFFLSINFHALIITSSVHFFFLHTSECNNKLDLPNDSLTIVLASSQTLV